MKFGTKERFAGVLVMGCAMSLISALFVDASHFFKIALAMFALAPVFLVYAVDVLLLGRVIGEGVVFFWLCASLYIAYFCLLECACCRAVKRPSTFALRCFCCFMCWPV